ncbi:hypothetical protein HYPBUDRAFT_152452 [Hyphopichia burtonii NRRL Y-1933]|uniref:PPP4R2-domain-containing protein n=1 Tax=Hyphopichia burtonii NRRL Y-1933 TaxID=984485 RepID=A0A1E4RJU5_9ASCO|nr:hypothetical protein HYPBUDRAFT_152452 [Hyphopichia burtonii NRRL Y-1933]ODV67552.1 hypothetical protein HYPBUDRAFT_152452 [Hyphopichia burtonii NRRL Y-1933]
MIAIPPLDPDLEKFLTKIVESKQYVPRSSLEWGQDILPRIIARIESMSSASQNGEKYAPRPEGINLPESIMKSKDKIVRNLQGDFGESPPFTIQRISELLIDPKGQGYILDNNVQLFKYFNSLTKLFVVSSSIIDFPPPTFETNKKKDPSLVLNGTEKLPESISLIKIPWLGEFKSNGKEHENKGNGTNENDDKENDDKENNDKENDDKENEQNETSLLEPILVESESKETSRRKRDDSFEDDDTSTSPSNGYKKSKPNDSSPISSDNSSDKSDTTLELVEKSPESKAKNESLQG